MAEPLRMSGLGYEILTRLLFPRHEVYQGWCTSPIKSMSFELVLKEMAGPLSGRAALI